MSVTIRCSVFKGTGTPTFRVAEITDDTRFIHIELLGAVFYLYWNKDSSELEVRSDTQTTVAALKLDLDKLQ